MKTYIAGMATVVSGRFEWDDAKDVANQAKHGVSFDEAATALLDPNVVFTEVQAADEPRFVALGLSTRLRVVFVVHIVRGARDRIISARKANATEERVYAENSKPL